MRAFIAACAACISSTCVYPIDTLYIKQQLQSAQKISNPMAGYKYSACSSFITTAVFFSAYERMLKICPEPVKIPISTLVGVSVSSVVATPLGVIKKRRQAITNNLSIIYDIDILDWIKLYTINIASKFPKSVVKYSVYEPLLKTLKLTYPVALAAFLSSFASSLISSILFEPIEYKRTLISLGIKTNSKNMYNGLRIGIISSILSNIIGHTILEIAAPRV